MAGDELQLGEVYDIVVEHRVTHDHFPMSRFHDLRHTHAAWLIAQGEHPKVIQQRLGHASISITMNTYGHLMDGMDERAADRLDAADVDTLWTPTVDGVNR